MKIKKVLSACLATAIVGGAPAISTQPEHSILREASAALLAYALGDTNGDGAIDAADASNILKTYAKLSTSNEGPTEFEISTFDVNADKRIDAVDASMLLAYYAFISTR